MPVENLNRVVTREVEGVFGKKNPELLKKLRPLLKEKGLMISDETVGGVNPVIVLDRGPLAFFSRKKVGEILEVPRVVDSDEIRGALLGGNFIVSNVEPEHLESVKEVGVKIGRQLKLEKVAVAPSPNVDGYVINF